MMFPYMRMAVIPLMLALGCPSPAQAWDWGLQCVPFARALSSIALYGDAWRWWSEAAGRYDRGHVPRAGSVLSFRPNLRMPLGHVGVVTRVVGAREIEIDHANWALPGAISRSVQVVDVSEKNDWTAVRVELGRSNYFGQVYATNGFIYGHPIELKPQLIVVAEALRADSPYVIQVADALRAGTDGAHVIDVAAFLRSRGAGEPAIGQGPVPQVMTGESRPSTSSGVKHADSGDARRSKLVRAIRVSSSD